MKVCQYPKLKWVGFGVGYCISLAFDVHFVVDGEPQRTTTHHTDRGFGGHGTVPDDMEHDGTAL